MLSPRRATVSRRELLRHAAAGLLGAAVAGCAAGAEYGAAELARPALLAALGPDAVRAIGERYRRALPREGDAEALRDAILAARPWSARLPWARDPTLEELVRRDFEQGRTVVVDGWVLSATEARQCALFSLLPG